MEFVLSPTKGPKGPRQESGVRSPPRDGGDPGWADGLKKLYNSVLNEPLPGSFDDLLKQLDKGDDG
ncbi:MAG: NepR family anti-sigma factor [Novosphingobium sp.]